MQRRHFLATTAGSLSLTAGCLSTSESPSSPDSMDDSTEVTSTTTETTTSGDPRVRRLPTTPPDASVDCDDDLYPITAADADSYPERSNGLKLEASTDTVAIGDDITFTLTNTGSESQLVGEKYKYNILEWDDEWTPLFYTPVEPSWTDVGIEILPGGGFEWPFTVDRRGLERENGTNPAYHTCSALETGEYRFAFFGSGRVTVATEFTVE